MIYKIDGEALKAIIKKEKLLMCHLSKQLGMGQCYLSQMCSIGRIRESVVKLLETQYGISPSLYVISEAYEKKAPKEDTQDQPKEDTQDHPKEDTQDQPKEDTRDHPKDSTDLALAISIGVEAGMKKAAELIAETMIDMIDYKKLALAVFYALDYADWRASKHMEGESNPIPVIKKEMDGKV